MNWLGWASLAYMTIGSGVGSYWAREALDLGWYSDRAIVGWLSNSTLVFSLVIWAWALV